MPYRHTQVGYVIIFLMLPAAIAAFVFKNMSLSWIVSIAGVLFLTLTVSVEIDCVRIWFGPRFIQKRFFLNEIESCQGSKSRCYSWGIHGWLGKGWLFNVSGFRSVELKMLSGKKYFIGTDQPEALEKAILSAKHANLLRTLKTE